MSKTCATRNPRSTGAPVSGRRPRRARRRRGGGGPTGVLPGAGHGRHYGTGVLPPIPPPRPAQSSAQGPGAAAGDDRTKTASAAQRPKGGRILVRSGGGGAGGPYAELPDGSGDQQGQPAAGGP